MGSRRVAGNGSSARTLARNSQWHLAEWLFHRLFARSDRCAISPAGVGMAPHVLDRLAARAARPVYPDEGAGIGSMETASRGKHGTGSAHRRRRMEALRLSRRAHDLHDVPFTRDA